MVTILKIVILIKFFVTILLIFLFYEFSLKTIA